MAPLTKASLILISAAIAKLAIAGTAHVYPSNSCDDTGYYLTINGNSDQCSKTYLEDSSFQTSPSNSGKYEAYFSLETEEADGCALVVGGGSADAAAPPCGECTILLHSANQCVRALLPTPFYAWECCGQECMEYCGQIPAKRSISGAADAFGARTANLTTPDIANLKNRNPLSSTPKVKRSDCSFAKSGDLYSQAGNPTKVSDTFNNCASADGCSVTYTGMVESSFSQTFDVSESTEAGLFDIVSETVTFGYSATWESSQSVSVSGSYMVAEGQSGYLTFSPLSQCTKGTFSGADCAGMGIPTGGDARAACVPETIAGGQTNGDINVVTSA